MYIHCGFFPVDFPQIFLYYSIRREDEGVLFNLRNVQVRIITIWTLGQCSIVYTLPDSQKSDSQKCELINAKSATINANLGK